MIFDTSLFIYSNDFIIIIIKLNTLFYILFLLMLFMLKYI
jgi:hypothetical protein